MHDHNLTCDDCGTGPLENPGNLKLCWTCQQARVASGQLLDDARIKWEADGSWRRATLIQRISYCEGDYVIVRDGDQSFQGTIRWAYETGKVPQSVQMAEYLGSEGTGPGCQYYCLVLDEAPEQEVDAGHADLEMIQAATLARCYFSIVIPGKHVRDGTVELYVGTHMKELEPLGPESIELDDDGVVD